MRIGPPDSILAAAASWVPTVQAWYQGQLLAASIPIVSGRARWNASAKVPDSLRVVIPRFSGRDDWLPTTPDSPLARYGQQLDVTLNVAGYDVRLTRCQIHSWTYDESTVTVVAEGMLQTAVDDRFPQAYAPRDGGTLRSEFVRALPAKTAAQFDTALADRLVPAAMNWNQERIDTLHEIARAWPAVIRPDSWGQVIVKPPPVLSTPVVSLTDGVDGTLVKVPRQDTRDGAYNIVQAVSSADGVTAAATATTTSGPFAVDTYGASLKTITSPLLMTVQQCLDAAEAERQQSLRSASMLNVQMAPDPRIELDDPVEIIRENRRDWGLVVAVDMPLTVQDGAMRIDVGVL